MGKRKFKWFNPLFNSEIEGEGTLNEKTTLSYSQGYDQQKYCHNDSFLDDVVLKNDENIDMKYFISDEDSLEDFEII
ncbi:hypothetical protein HZS_6263 [Henneguya salminicola]|nr:hypothetical protein HZS_6263 [Henneguya salminicola]